MNVSYNYFAGIDVSKPYLDVHLRPSNKAERFANTALGHRQLIKFLKTHQIQLIVLEATGGYEHAVVVAMVCAGLHVHVAQPQIIHAFAVSLRLRAKNDTIDASVCSRYAQDRGHELRVIDKIDKTLESLRALVVRRDQLVEIRTMEKNRLQQASDKMVVASIKRTITSIHREILRIEKAIDQTIQADEVLAAKAQKLQEITGIGPQTTRVLLAQLPELGTTSTKSLNALVGVAPFAADSGDRQARRHIAGGRSMVRDGLYMACLTAVFHDPVLQPYYQKLTARGLPHKSAMMACIRKLLAYLDRQIRELIQTLAASTQQTQTTPATLLPATAL